MCVPGRQIYSCVLETAKVHNEKRKTLLVPMLHRKRARHLVPSYYICTRQNVFGLETFGSLIKLQLVFKYIRYILYKLYDTGHATHKMRLVSYIRGYNIKIVTYLNLN